MSMNEYTINGMPSSILLSLTINNWHNRNESFDQCKDTVLKAFWAHKFWAEDKMSRQKMKGKIIIVLFLLDFAFWIKPPERYLKCSILFS